MTDIEIAHKCALKPISEIAAAAGIDEAYVEPYGKYKAKISLDLLHERAAAPDVFSKCKKPELLTPLR